jgi:hypothetical protein
MAENQPRKRKPTAKAVYMEEQSGNIQKRHMKWQKTGNIADQQPGNVNVTPSPRISDLPSQNDTNDGSQQASGDKVADGSTTRASTIVINSSDDEGTSNEQDGREKGGDRSTEVGSEPEVENSEAELGEQLVKCSNEISLIICSERLMKKWSSPVYTLFKTMPEIRYDEANRRYHLFQCAHQNCNKKVQQYLDKKMQNPLGISANMPEHAGAQQQ